MDALRLSDQKFRSPPEPEFLHLFRPERGYAHLRYPDGKVRHRPYLGEFGGPFMYCPVIPIERKAVHRDHIDVAQYAMLPNGFYEHRIDGRDASEDPLQCG